MGALFLTLAAVPAVAATVKHARSAGTAKEHAVRGVVGTITAISGNTITIQGRNSTTYTVDAANSTVTVNGASSTISALAVGDQIFVKGTASGTGVTAQSIMKGIMKGFGRPGMARGFSR